MIRLESNWNYKTKIYGLYIDEKKLGINYLYSQKINDLLTVSYFISVNIK